MQFIGLHITADTIILNQACVPKSKSAEAVGTNRSNMSLALSDEMGRGGGWGLTLDCNIWTLHPTAKRANRQLFSSETGRDIDGVNWQATHTQRQTHKVRILLLSPVA